MPEYVFDVKLFACIRVQAKDEREARNLLTEELSCASCNAGVWPDGNPMVFEVSADGDMDLIEIDGEAV